MRCVEAHVEVWKNMWSKFGSYRDVVQTCSAGVARILKLFSASPPLFQKALFRLTRVL
ncbi:hypothetical protein E2C01_058605 [Portunus trituberculatus]|uniref:Uncharacterized protein n=1 Tax=Portunus trituberculatus TaxID=210409 RepID=A0A5B7H5V7_PORTR|nr:hypothetical protein [Portunus trituberculatus]